MDNQYKILPYTKQLDTEACYRLAEAIIKNTLLTSVRILYPNNIHEQKISKRTRIIFGKNSPIVEWYAHLAGYDEVRIRRAIIAANIE